MRKYSHLWFVFILLGLTACQEWFIKRPELITETSPLVSPLRPPIFSSSISRVSLTPPIVSTATAETERIPAPTVTAVRVFTPPPSPTSMPVNTATLIPTPVYTITSVKLPPECYTALPEDEPSWEVGVEPQPCSHFKFSPDGDFLGFFFGPAYCGRGIIILDTQTAEIVYQSGIGQGLRFTFFPNSKAWIATGHCEGGQASLLDLKTGELRFLGELGQGGWNVSHTAIATAASPYQGVCGAVWGYNVEKDFLFLPQPEMCGQLEQHLLWVPGGSHILYLHRPISYTANTYMFSQPSRIVRVNADSGEKQVLLSEPEYDYHFCDNPNIRCDHWYGDWIQVRRFPFEPQAIPYTDDFHRLEAVTCLYYGINCPESPELFALNWRTAELVSWDEIQLPTLTPTPVQ